MSRTFPLRYLSTEIKLVCNNVGPQGKYFSIIVSPPFAALFLPSAETGEKGTSVISLSDGDSTDREAGPGGVAGAGLGCTGELAVELGPRGGQEMGRAGRPPRGDG